MSDLFVHAGAPLEIADRHTIAPRPAVEAISFTQRNCGKNIKSSKVASSWTLKICGTQYVITLKNSRITGRKEVLVDGYCEHEQQEFSNFSYKWPIDGHEFKIQKVSDRSDFCSREGKYTSTKLFCDFCL